MEGSEEVYVLLIIDNWSELVNFLWCCFCSTHSRFRCSTQLNNKYLKTLLYISATLIYLSSDL